MNHMTKLCKETGVKLLAYGVLAGGLLSVCHNVDTPSSIPSQEKWLGQAEPKKADLNTASLGKYKRTVDQFGGWAMFQVKCAVQLLLMMLCRRC